MALQWVGRVAWWAFLVALVFVVYRRFAPPVPLHDLGAAPALVMRALDGDTISLASLHGQVVVINVWATWCPPCRVETPGFVGLQERFGSDVQFLGLSTDDSEEEVREFAERVKINYPLLVGRNLAGSGYSVAVLPTTFLIDRGGRIRFRHEGLLLAHALRPAIDRLRREAPRN